MKKLFLLGLILGLPLLAAEEKKKEEKPPAKSETHPQVKSEAPKGEAKHEEKKEEKKEGGKKEAKKEEKAPPKEAPREAHAAPKSKEPPPPPALHSRTRHPAPPVKEASAAKPAPARRVLPTAANNAVASYRKAEVAWERDLAGSPNVQWEESARAMELGPQSQSAVQKVSDDLNDVKKSLAELTELVKQIAAKK